MSSVSDSYQASSSNVGETDALNSNALSDQFASQAQTGTSAAPSSWDEYSQQDNGTSRSFDQAGKSFTQGMGSDSANLVRQGADGTAYLDHGSATDGSYAPQRAHDAFSAGAAEDEDDASEQGQAVSSGQSGPGTSSLNVQFDYNN